MKYEDMPKSQLIDILEKNKIINWSELDPNLTVEQNSKNLKCRPATIYKYIKNKNINFKKKQAGRKAKYDYNLYDLNKTTLQNQAFFDCGLSTIYRLKYKKIAKMNREKNGFK